uniref:Uncharacterized protein n=1 Tax=Amphimedon queenslandica TaxID=400682 RepID=A0A1X7UZZ6_AMPQE
MIRSVVQVPDDIMQEIAFLDKSKAHEIKLLQDLCGILRPFEEATNIAQDKILLQVVRLLFVFNLMVNSWKTSHKI